MQVCVTLFGETSFSLYPPSVLLSHISPSPLCPSSYVLTGTDQGLKDTFGSTCHGAGRALSRAKARYIGPVDGCVSNSHMGL